jgi:hypothetical protein
MRSRFRQLIVTVSVLAAGLLLAVVTVPGQTTTYKAPRAPDGHPNLNGIWQALNTAYWDIEAHPAAPGPLWQLGAAYAVPGGLGVVDGPLPYKPEALAMKRENFEKRLERDPEMRCYLPGVPRAMYMPSPFQIIQGQQHIMMIHEFAGAVRTIYMTDHTEAPADSWMGWSNGRWDGESLVVDTTGFYGKTWFDRAGNFHSPGLRVVERITPRSPQTLNYEATITDPDTFTRPWTMRMPLYRRVEPNAQLTEFRCVEFSEDLIYGHLARPSD